MTFERTINALIVLVILVVTSGIIFAPPPQPTYLICSVDGIEVFTSAPQERIRDLGPYYMLDGRKFTPPERSICEIIH